MTTDIYRSIFFEDDWAQTRYQGWQSGWPTADLRLLVRKRGPICRKLALVLPRQASSAQGWRQWISRNRPGLLDDVIVHLFEDDPEGAGFLEQAGFRRIGSEDRLLNIATSVIDLSQGEDELAARLSDDCRRKLRKAERAGYIFHDCGDGQGQPGWLEAFVAALESEASAKGFSHSDRATIRRMLADRSASLHLVTSGNDLLCGLLAYKAGASGYFLHGASAQRDNHGSTHLLQWGTILALRGHALRWYDMGGLPTVDGSDGISRFKLAFGGELVQLGNEFRRSGALARLAIRLRRRSH